MGSLEMTDIDLFTSFPFAKGFTLKNHLAMAPMTTWAGNSDNTVSDDEVAYFQRRAKDVGLIITGCSHVTANGIGFSDEFAAYDDRFVPGLARLAQAARSGGAPAILQLFHAGNKAVAEFIEGGDVVSASAVTPPADPFSPQPTPRALSESEILDIVRAFGEATRRAIEAGFDGVELHGAHGFLIQNFFSPYFNRRDDQWGGSLENRLRFAMAVVDEVLKTIQTHATRPFLVGFRISPEESVEGGLRLGDFDVLVERLIDKGIDYLHISQPGGLLTTHPLDDPDGPLITEHLLERVAGRLPVIAAGGIRTPQQARQAIGLGLSLVAIGQGLVVAPDWGRLAQERRDADIDSRIGASDVVDKLVPQKMWNAIAATPGWFDIRD